MTLFISFRAWNVCINYNSAEHFLNLFWYKVRYHTSVFFPSLDKFLSSLKAINFKSNIKIATPSKVIHKYTSLFTQASLHIMEKVKFITKTNTDNFLDGLSKDNYANIVASSGHGKQSL